MGNRFSTYFPRGADWRLFRDFSSSTGAESFDSNRIPDYDSDIPHFSCSFRHPPSTPSPPLPLPLTPGDASSTSRLPAPGLLLWSAIPPWQRFLLDLSVLTTIRGENILDMTLPAFLGIRMIASKPLALESMFWHWARGDLMRLIRQWLSFPLCGAS